MYRLLILLIILMNSITAAKAAGPYQKFQIGNWIGGMYTYDGTNQFSHCAAYAIYNSQITLFVSLPSQGNWLLGFMKDDWEFKPNVPVALDLSFDGSPPIRVKAYPASKNFVRVDMPVNSTLIKTFMDAQVMNAYSGNNIYAFSLEGTKPLFEKLAACWEVNKPKNKTNAASISETPTQHPKTNSKNPTVQNDGQETSTTSESEREKQKLITEAAAEHQKCMRSQMREIVPYSDEPADVLAQVVITKCAESEQKFTRLGIALFNAPRAEVEKIVGNALADQKKNMVADIVSFRAQLNKSIQSQQKENNTNNEKEKKPKSETGI